MRLPIRIWNNSHTYATWNPSDKAWMTLSGGNLVATSAASGDWVRATIWKSSGKWYIEMTVTTNSWGLIVGVANTTETGYPWISVNGWGYFSWSWQKQNNGWFAYWVIFTTGDIMGIAYDMTWGTITFYKNNTSQGQAFTWLTGTLYPMVGVLGSGCVITANYWATTMAYTAPSGYNQWLYL